VFHPRRSPWLTSLLLSVYLTANVGSGLLHDHDHAHYDDHDASRCQVASHDHEEAEGHGLAPAHAAHDDDCAVCRLAGQRVMPAEVGGLDDMHQTSVELTVHYVGQTTVSILRSTHSRAPPLLG